MNNASEEYDAVISLGGSCASCLQIRKRELQTFAYPFDYVFDYDENAAIDDDELDSIVKKFVNAISIKAGQLNKELRDYLPIYLSNLCLF